MRSLAPRLCRLPPAQDADHITIPLALQWAQRQSRRPAGWAHRLTCVRGFARYWSAIDPRPKSRPGACSPIARLAHAHTFTPIEQIGQLLEAAKQMGGLPGLTYYCLLGLLAVTGLRLGEVLNLKTEDVDLAQASWSLSAPNSVKLDWYRSMPQLRKCSPNTRTSAIGPSVKTCPTSLSPVEATAWTEARSTALFTASPGRLGSEALPPAMGRVCTIFATGSPLRPWCTGIVRDKTSKRASAQSCPPILGHGHVSDTYWYLTICPELMGVVVNRMEEYWEKSS